jgi:hypothetical protein
MKWYYLWRLRQANIKMRAALNSALPGPCPKADDPTFPEWVHGSVKFFLAHSDVEYYLKKLKSDSQK